MANETVLQHLLKTIEKGGAIKWNAFKAGLDTLDLTKAPLSQQAMVDYNFSRADLSGAQLFNCDLSGADLTGANLAYADLRRANLANAYLSRANLAGANLAGANLVDTNLDNALMTGAKLGGAHLVGASLIDATMEKVDLRGACLKFANLQGSRMDGANVEDADLTGVELEASVIASLRHFDRAIQRSRKGEGETPNGGAKKRLKPWEEYDNLFLEEDCYKILGVQKGATLEDIARAYRQRVKEYHPDRVAHLGEKLRYVAGREFERIQHAHHSLTQRLSNPMINIRVRGGQLAEKSVTEYSADDYLEMLKWQPNSDILHYNLGIKYLQMGLAELAVKAYEKALELNPANEFAAHNLRVARLMQALER